MSDILLPEGWLNTIIGRYLYVKNGFSFKSNHYVKASENSHPVIRISDIDGEYALDSNAVHVINKVEGFDIENGDLLIAMSGATTGKIGIYKGMKVAYQNQRVGNIKLLSEKFGNHLFRNYLILFIKDKILKASYGGAQPNISGNTIEKISILLPPLSEQKIIAEKLDLLLAQVKETKSRLERIPEILKQFRQSVLSDACFCDFLTSTDKYQLWKEDSLKELTTKIGSGSTPKGGNNVYKNKGIPLVRSMNIYSNYIKYDDLAYIDDEQAKRLANVEIQPDDILLNITGASIGRVNIAPQLFVGGRVNQHVSIIRCNKQKLLPKFLQIYLASPVIQKWIVKENYGATRQALTKAMIEKLIISYPPIEEQNAIIRRVEQLFAYADKIEQQVNVALEKVNNLTQSILAKAFRGELTTQWRAENVDLITGENSATALLEKIQAEREQNNKSKKEK